MIKIREAIKEDLEGLGKLFEQLVTDKSHKDKMIHTFEKIQNDGSYILLVAEQDNEIVGTIMGILCYDLVGECQPFMVVENVIIHEGKRRMGIGKCLMNHLEEKARVNDVSYMMLISAATREASHTFYESIGYEKDTVRGFKKYL